MPAWRTFDFMFCDEVQDMSPLQHGLLERLVAKDGNVVIVGDRRQSLYLFSGADSRSMDYAIDTYGCQSFPMTVCWRQSDVLANEVVSALGYVDGEKIYLPTTNQRKHWSIHGVMGSIPINTTSVI